MSAGDLDAALSFARLRAVDELLSLMRRVNVADLTTPEVVALVAVFSAADQRVDRVEAVQQVGDVGRRERAELADERRVGPGERRAGGERGPVGTHRHAAHAAELHAVAGA